jgi:hypothetical protein
MAFEDTGSVTKVADQSETAANNDITYITTDNLECYGERGASIEQVSFFDTADHKKTSIFDGNEHCALVLNIVSNTHIQYPIFGFTMKDMYGNQITGMNTFVYDTPSVVFEAHNRMKITIRFTLPSLKNGTYTISPAIAEGTMENHIQHHWVHDAIVFQVNNKNIVNQIGWYFILHEVQTTIELI